MFPELHFKDNFSTHSSLFLTLFSLVNTCWTQWKKDVFLRKRAFPRHKDAVIFSCRKKEKYLKKKKARKKMWPIHLMEYYSVFKKSKEVHIDDP